MSITMMMFAVPCAAQVVVYPASPGLPASTEITGLTVNGVAVPVQVFGQGVDSANAVNVANFSCSGGLTVEITAAATITGSVIRPRRLGIVGTSSGNKLTFTLPGPQKLLIEINGYHHFCFFANPLEVNPPQQGAAGVTYFGPGAANPGTITLQSNQTVYLAGGAVVTARISGSNVQNVKVLGRGILQGTVSVSGATNMVFDGIVVYNTGTGWTNTLTSCSHSAYRNVKVISFPIPYGTDGIDPVACQYFGIDNCFIRTGDDCIAVKSWPSTRQKTDSITITNCIGAGINNNDGTTLGYELENDSVTNVHVSNCDYLYSNGGGATGGHSGFSVICDGPAWVENIRFENIHCEEHVAVRSLELTVTNGTMWGSSPPGAIGHIKGVYIKNCSWANSLTPFRLAGLDSNHLVENVTFDHCYVGPALLTSARDANFQINSFVKNVQFIVGPPEFASVIVKPLFAAIRPNTACQFIAQALDQYKAAISPPPSFAWSIKGGPPDAGTISASGLFTAGSAEGGPYIIAASATIGGVTKEGTSPVFLSSPAAGLTYAYYEGNWAFVPDSGSLTPVKSGTVPNFDISVANRADYFAFMFIGYINIPSNGLYGFWTQSDAGSKLYIGDTLVVKNDGLHGPLQVFSNIALTAGMHPIRVDFFEDTGGQQLTVNWAGPGFTRMAIPAGVLSTGNDGAKVTPGLRMSGALRPSLTAGITSGILRIGINRTGSHTVNIINLAGAIVRHYSGTGPRTYGAADV
jgi:hypothetical protein